MKLLIKITSIAMCLVFLGCKHITITNSTKVLYSKKGIIVVHSGSGRICPIIERGIMSPSFFIPIKGKFGKNYNEVFTKEKMERGFTPFMSSSYLLEHYQSLDTLFYDDNILVILPIEISYTREEINLNNANKKLVVKTKGKEIIFHYSDERIKVYRKNVITLE